MSMKTCGERMDIHGGGLDLSSRITRTSSPSPSRSRAGRSRATGCTTACSDGHREDGRSSVGNVVSLRASLESRGREPILVFFLNAHYRSPVEYSDAAMEAARAQVAAFRAATRVARGACQRVWLGRLPGRARSTTWTRPGALAILHDWRAAGQIELLRRGLDVFGVAIDEDDAEAPPDLRRLAEARDTARAASRF